MVGRRGPASHWIPGGKDQAHWPKQNETEAFRNKIKGNPSFWEWGAGRQWISSWNLFFSLSGVFSTRSSSLEQVDFSSATSVILKSGSCSPVPVRAEARKSNCRRARFPFLCSLLDIYGSGIEDVYYSEHMGPDRGYPSWFFLFLRWHHDHMVTRGCLLSLSNSSYYPPIRFSSFKTTRRGLFHRFHHFHPLFSMKKMIKV